MSDERTVLESPEERAFRLGSFRLLPSVRVRVMRNAYAPYGGVRRAECGCCWFAFEVPSDFGTPSAWIGWAQSEGDAWETLAARIEGEDV